ANVAMTVDATFLSGRNSTGSAVTQTFGTLSMGANTITVGPGVNVVGQDTNFGIAFGATTLSGNPTLNVNNNGLGVGTLTLGAIAGAGGATGQTLTFGGPGNTTVSGAITTGSGGRIVKSGGGVLTLSSASNNFAAASTA